MDSDYPSGKVLLENARHEYQVELDRISTIDTKVSISMVAMGTYFTLALPKIQIAETWQSLGRLSYGSFALGCAAFVFYALFLGCMAASAILMILAIFTRKYTRFKPQDFAEKRYMEMPENDFSMLTASYYMIAMRESCAVNQKRTDLYDWGLRLWLLSVLAFPLQFVLLHLLH